MQPHLLGISRRRKVVPSSFNQKMGRRRIKGDRKRVNGFLHLHDDREWVDISDGGGIQLSIVYSKSPCPFLFLNKHNGRGPWAT